MQLTCAFIDDVNDVVDIVYRCLERMSINRSRESRHSFILENVRRCVKDFAIFDSVTVRKRAVYDWSIGEAPGPVISGLCVDCFAKSYNVSHNLVESCCKQLRPGHVQYSSERDFDDTTAVKKDKKGLKELERLVQYNNYELTADDKGLMLLPKSEQSIDCYSWMHNYFTVFGEKVPNGDKIHLEHAPIKSIWEEYVDACTEKTEPTN